MFINVGEIEIDDIDYPKSLREVYNPPKKLYFRGDKELLKKTCISVIGTRKYTEYGEANTKKIIAELAVLDIAIVSGLAIGIDSIAHEAALEFGIPTIAVLGSGIDNIYPKCNLKLASKIERAGLIISEYPEETEAIKYHFPQRNRIVSGLSIATVVVEAAERSGALITAKLALEQGRDIFTIPGDIDRISSKGPLRLLQNGAAYPISSGQDIIEVLRRQPFLFKEEEMKDIEQTKAKAKLEYILSIDEEEIIDAMPNRKDISLDDIMKRLDNKMKTEKLLATISMLEIRGIIHTKNGKYIKNC